MDKLYILPPFVLQSLIWIPTRLILRFFVHLKITGLENLRDLKSGVIFASNHSSELDPILVPATLPFLSRFMPMFYASREQSFYKNSGWRKNFYGGLFFKLWGAYPVFPGKRNYEHSLQKHISIASDGNSISIFPEGRKTIDGKISEPKGGVGFLSWRTNSPIVPVAIRGSFRLTFKKFLARKHSITVIFGKPIDASAILKADISPTATIPPTHRFRMIAVAVMSEIKELLAKEGVLAYVTEKPSRPTLQTS